MRSTRSYGTLRHVKALRRGRLGACALGAAALLGSLPATAQTAPCSATDSPAATEQARAFITAGETKWVAAVASGNVDIVRDLFGDDLVGVDSDGNVYGKDVLLAELREAPKYFSANQLNKLNVRFFGCTAVAQGDETFTRAAGDPKRARFVFTDTWIFRDGAWKVAATEAVLAPEVPK